MSPSERARAGFVRHFGHAPAGVVFAPGRVNLIGEHVDYNDGLVLPMPIAAGTAVAWSPGEKAIEAIALDFGDEQDRFVCGTVSPHWPADWRSYVRGMAASQASQGFPSGGARLAIAGSIPRGSGLSSSASLCVGLGRALAAAMGAEAPPARTLALAAQSAEHDWAGVNCGIMDQMAVAAGEPGAALLIDCADLSVRPVPLPDDWAVLIVQSGVTRGLVDGHYNQRRRDCEAAARTLGVDTLREASVDLIAVAELDPLVRRRARHVVGEIARVEAAVTAIERADLAALGELLRASHASLRDDFEVSVPAVDSLVDVLGAAIGTDGGARMTGGGFGGAVVAVLKAGEVARVSAAVQAGYRSSDGAPLQIMVEQTSRALAGNNE
jgi:galactokinase